MFSATEPPGWDTLFVEADERLYAEKRCRTLGNAAVRAAIVEGGSVPRPHA